MNRKQNLEVFAKTPVRKAVLLQIVPAVASQMVTLVYNLADTYFVGMLKMCIRDRSDSSGSLWMPLMPPGSKFPPRSPRLWSE